MTTLEWGRARSGAAVARRVQGVRGVSLAAVAEFAVAGLLLILMSEALLGPVFNPTQDADAAGWLRSLWLPAYGVILVLTATRPMGLRRVAWGAALLAPLLLLAFISSQWSILPEVTGRRAIALTFTTLFGVWLAARFEWRELLGLLAGVFLFLAIGSYIATLVAPSWAVHATIHPGAWKGLWYEKNGMGAMMSIGTLACAASAMMQPARRMLWTGAACLCAGLVLLSTSTTSLLALLLVGAGLTVVSGLKRGGALAVATGWIMVAGLVGAAGLLAFAPDLVFEALGKDPSLTGRTDIWGAVLRRVSERPLLGYGFGAFWEAKEGPVSFVRDEVDWLAPTAHNGWLELLLSFGWTGMVVFGLHLIAIAAAALSRLGRGPEAYWAILFVSLFVLFSLSESTIMQQNNLSWVLYAVTATKLFQRRPAAQAAARPARRASAVPLARTGAASAWPVHAAQLAWAPAPPAGLPTRGFSVLLLLIFSVTWIPLVFGSPPPAQLPATVQIVYLTAYLIGLVLAFHCIHDTLALVARSPLLIALLALAGVSTLWSIAPGDTVIRLVALAGTTLAGVSLAARLTWSDLAEVLATAFAVIAVGCLVTALLVPGIGRMETEFPGAWRGLFGHKNALGGNMAVAVPIFIAAAIYKRQRRWLWWGFAALAAVLLLASGSATALVAGLLGGAALLFVAMVRHSGLTGVAASYGALFAVVAAGLAVVFAGDTLLELLGKDATLTGRTTIWEASLRQIGDRPWLGFGYATLWDDAAADGPTAWIWSQTLFKPHHAHNSWLEIWLGIGLGGVILWSLLLLQTWIAAFAIAYRHAGAYLATPFVLAFSVTALSESMALTYNDLRWVIFTALAVKLTRWSYDPLETAAAVEAERATSAAP